MRIPWRRLAEPESIALGLAVGNWARIAYLIERDSGIACIVCPWYHSWGYAYEPFRLLAAAALLTVGRWWSRALAAVLAAQVLVVGFMVGLTPAEFSAVRAGIQEWPFLTQGLVGALVLGVAWFRLARDPGCRYWLRWPTRIALVFVVLAAIGFASDFASYRACEDRVAVWVARDLLHGEALTAWGGYRGWGDSASAFRRVGANLLEYQESDSSRRVSLGGFRPILPFIVRIDYSAGDGRGSGVRAFACFFGSIRPLENAEWVATLDRTTLHATALPWAWFLPPYQRRLWRPQPIT